MSCCDATSLLQEMAAQVRVKGGQDGGGQDSQQQQPEAEIEEQAKSLMQVGA